MTFTKVEYTDVEDGDFVVAAVTGEVVAGIARKAQDCKWAVICNDQGQLRFLRFANEIYKVVA